MLFVFYVKGNGITNKRKVYFSLEQAETERERYLARGYTVSPIRKEYHN